MAEHYRELYTREEKIIVASYVHQLDMVANAGFFGQGLIEIYKAFGKLNLQEIENILREDDCRTFLIGLRMEGSDESNTFKAFLPGTDREFPYFLWTEVNWQAEARRILFLEGITTEQNFERLAETGLLTPKK